MTDSNAMDGCPSISSPVACHASLLVWQVSGRAAAMSGGCGRSSCAWLASYDHAGSWQRTRSGFCQLTIDGPGEPFSERWSSWAIVRDGAYGALPMWERHTAASASSCLALVNQLWPTPMVPNGGRKPKDGRMSLTGKTPDGKKRQVDLDYAVRTWPTPQTDNANNGRNRKLDGTKDQSGGTYGATLVDTVMLWPTPRAEKIDGEASVGYSPTLHQTVQQWPTPKAGNANGAGLHGQGSPDLQTVVTLWPTPQTRDWKNGQASEETLHHNARPLSERVIQDEKAAQAESRSLNADWVEMLQGFPPGWTIPAGPPGRGKSRRSGNRRAPSPAG